MTPASFEPTLDYVVVKVPRFNFEKFPAADTTLTTTMKSVGEAMAIGRNYATALQKALRSLEKRGSSFHWGDEPRSLDELIEVASTPTDGRIIVVQQALRKGGTVAQLFDATGIDPWFLDQIVLINEVAEFVRTAGELDVDTLRIAKEHGFSDAQIAQLRARQASRRSARIRHALGLRPVYKTVDTCAGEFPALTPYHYSSYDFETEVAPSDRTQGRHHRLRTRTASGRASSSTTRACTRRSRCRLPATRRSWSTATPRPSRPTTTRATGCTSSRSRSRTCWRCCTPKAQSGEILGVICQLGGQTPLGLAKGIQDAGYRILGTSPEAIDLAEERQLFSDILDAAGLIAPRHGTAIDPAGAVDVAEDIGYPVLVRPSFVLGGRGMEIVYDTASLRDYFVRTAGEVIVAPGMPLLVDRFLDDAVELDVDALYDGTSSTSAASWSTSRRPASTPATPSCTLPPVSLGRTEVDRVRDATLAIAEGRRRAGPDERAVRDQRRRALRDRGESTGEPHRAVRVEGPRHPAREGRGPHHGRRHDRRAQV